MSRGARAAAIAAVALVVAGCNGGSSAPPASSGDPATGSSTQSPASAPTTPVELFPEAVPVAVEYVRDAALGRTAAARRLVAAPDDRALRSLSRLDRWLGSIPIARIDATPAYQPLEAGYPDGAVGVGLDLRARLSSRTPWVPLGRRVLVMTHEDSDWRVASDATHDEGLGIAPAGLSLFQRPRFLTGRRATVVYGLQSAKGTATDILKAADAAVPHLSSTYGGGPAAARPLIFLVKDREQGEQLSGVGVSRQTPLGTLAQDFTYVFLRQYAAVDEVGRSSSVVALMTMLATREMLGRGPTSLTNGVATYEEDRYLATRGFILPLDDIERAYPAYPSLARWSTAAPLWGLSGKAGLLASQDSLAMVHVIVQNHGGVAALRRLGKAFASHGIVDFTPRQVRGAFRKALKVSFESVRDEARAYVASGDWKYH
ncbi:MAG: hypothetical protein QOJ13_1293 [Gaiellales bacterium]|jgi:hypothetical protein|nr:hypothetical protein [Gaiellales bacterium]